jgi:uncharacterized repeat protein (TIGR01451 family)
MRSNLQHWRRAALATALAATLVAQLNPTPPPVSAETAAVRVAYVYNGNIPLRDAWKSFFELRGLAVSLVPLASVGSTSFTNADVIVLGDDTGDFNSPYTWLGGRLTLLNVVNANKPIVTLGYAAQFFDAHGGLNLGWLPSWLSTQSGAVAVNPADAIWTDPDPVPLGADDVVRLYSQPHTSVDVHNPTANGVIRIGRETDDADHYTIAAQSWTGQLGTVCRTQWGFRNGPAALTPYGKDAIINLLSSNPCVRGQVGRTDVQIVKRASASTVTVGQTLTYTLQVSNNGPAAAPGVVVVDTLPAGVVVNGISSTVGSCALAANVVTCNIGTLAAGSSATITIVVKATEPGVLNNTARVRGGYSDLKPDNDISATATTVTQPQSFTPLKLFPYQPNFNLAAAVVPGDLSIFGIEVTQGIQCFNTARGLAGCADNSLPVVAKKESTARIYLRYAPTIGVGTRSNVPVRLHIFANGVEYIANTQGRATSAIDQGAAESANVYFNVNFSNDINVSFYAVVDPNNTQVESNEGNNRFPASGTITLNFRKQRTLKIVGQRLRYRPSGYTGTQYAGGWAVNGGAADWLEQMLPVRNNGINYVVASGYKDWTTSLAGGDGQHALIGDLNNTWIVQNAFAWLFGAGAYTGADHVYGWAPNQGYSGGHADMPVYPHAGGLGIVGIGTDRVSDGASNTDSPGGGAFIFGHELVHDYDVKHTDTADACGSSDDSSAWPYATSSIQEFGFNPLTGKIYDPATTHDLMSYCPAGGSTQGWIAPYTWSTMAAELDAPGSVFARSTEATLATGPMLVTALRISNPALGPQTASFDAAHKVDADMPLLTPSPGDYTLEMRDGANTLLSSVPFTASFVSEYSAHAGHPHDGPGHPEPTAFAHVQIGTPWATGTTRLQIRRSGALLTERLVSTNAPMVNITSPAAPVTWTVGTTQTLTWTGVDPDADSLTYSVFYSHDGLNWDMLATGLTTPSYEVPVDAIKGSTHARFRVVANDGVLSGDDETDYPISVPDKAPNALISSPAAGSANGIGALLVLQGSGNDFEDGTLPDVSLSWSSDRAGALGSGPSVPVNSLTQGWHRITLSVTDSAGQTSASSVNVYIGARAALPLIVR